jgi:hypothetical protein
MPPKAIFAQTTMDYWVEVAAKLRDDYSWDICYFTGRKQQEKLLKLFPQAVFHSKAEIRGNFIPKGCESIVASPLDKPLLSALSNHESIFLKMMDRQNYNGALTYFERISRYHSQIMYWKSVLEHFRPDVVVYRITPHVSHDYALYSLCRIMNIQTIMFERTSLPGFVYPVNSFEEGSEIIRNTYNKALEESSHQKVSLTPETELHVKNLSKTYADAMPYYLKYKLKRYKKSGDVGGNVSILLRLVKDLAKAYWTQKTDFDKVPNYMRKKYHTNMGGFKRKKILATYNQLANTVNLAVPYIFVALQCEPERQTCPAGGVFGNQYLMIDMLSKLIPEGWKIYVKEHISQFKVYQAAERAKPVEFYKMIASMPNVQLVPLTYTSFELIDKAKASATVSGTVGWESVVRGKPAMLFGYAWYRDCKGIFITHTVESCKKAIGEIKKGYQVNMSEVRCFAQIVERCSVRGYTHKKKYQEMNNSISHEENVENLARAIHEFASEFSL